MNYWLLKTEAGCYSIDDLKRDKKTGWGGVRNYQARNFLRDSMEKGDLCLIYHSSCEVPAVVGVGKITGKGVDPTQFDPKDEHFDPKSKKDKPQWYEVEISFVKKLQKEITLTEIKMIPALKGIVVAQTGSRLSVQPVSKQHFEEIVKRGGSK